MKNLDDAGTNSWKVSVAPDYFELVGVPKNEIPALVAQMEQGPDDTWLEEMYRIGAEWCHTHGCGVPSSANHLACRPEVLKEVLARIKKRRPLTPWESQVLELTGTKKREFVKLLNGYDAQSCRPKIADTGIGHILHVGYTCERLIVEVLQCVFGGDDSDANMATIQNKLDNLSDELEEVHITDEEQRVLNIVAVAPFEICWHTWTSGHSCLFALARDFLCEASDFALLLTANDMQRLLDQLAIERSKVTAGNEVAQQPVVMIKAIQGAQHPTSKPSPVDGRVSGGSPRTRAAKKGVITKADEKKKAVEDAAARRNDAQRRQPPQLEAKHWMAWLLKTGHVTIQDTGNGKFQCIYKWHAATSAPSDTEVANTLSFVLGEKVGQQRIGELRKKVEQWLGLSLPTPDFPNLFGGQQELDLDALDKLIASATKTFQLPRNDHDAQMTPDQQDGAYVAGEEG